MYATCQINDVVKAILIQKPLNLHAARTVMAHADNYGVHIELIHARRNSLHGHVHTARNLAALYFAHFPHIQQQWLRLLGISDPLRQFRRGNVLWDQFSHDLK